MASAVGSTVPKYIPGRARADARRCENRESDKRILPWSGEVFDNSTNRLEGSEGQDWSPEASSDSAWSRNAQRPETAEPTVDSAGRVDCFHRVIGATHRVNELM